MACNAVTTGEGFLSETLAHLDCQAQTMGGLGYGALADPNSPAGIMLVALLTLFIALFGVRLLFAGHVGAQDAVGAVLKVGIVLTLAASWPAYRAIAYETVLHGPAEIAAALGNQNLPAAQGGLAIRLQGLDNNIVLLTSVGTGRQAGALDVPGEQRSSFGGIALQDESAFGWGRTVFLSATIGPLAALRIAAGLLLAVAPLVAGLLLFEFTRGLFSGWARGLFLTALGSIGLTVLLAIQVAVMEPWILDTLQRRSLGYATPGAATELLAMSLAFAIASFGLVALLARVSFQANWPMSPWFGVPEAKADSRTERSSTQSSQFESVRVHSRALAVSDGMLATMRRESGTAGRFEERRAVEVSQRGSLTEGRGEAGGSSRPDSLGNSYRRNASRKGGAQRNRDSRR